MFVANHQTDIAVIAQQKRVSKVFLSKRDYYGSRSRTRDDRLARKAATNATKEKEEEEEEDRASESEEEEEELEEKESEEKEERIEDDDDNNESSCDEEDDNKKTSSSNQRKVKRPKRGSGGLKTRTWPSSSAIGEGEGALVNAKSKRAGARGAEEKATHWSYVMAEMKWLARDFGGERLEVEAARQVAPTVGVANGVPVSERTRNQRDAKAARQVAKQVSAFWEIRWEEAKKVNYPATELAKLGRRKRFALEAAERGNNFRLHSSVQAQTSQRLHRAAVNAAAAGGGGGGGRDPQTPSDDGGANTRRSSAVDATDKCEYAVDRRDWVRRR